jgi:hypothetical protein
MQENVQESILRNEDVRINQRKILAKVRKTPRPKINQPREGNVLSKDSI